jgi:hypothetical protein
MAQLSYNEKNPVAFAGMLADIGPKFSSTGWNEEAAPIPFGLGLTKGANEGGYKLPAASTDKIVGVGLHSHDVNRIGYLAWATDAGIPAADKFNLLEEGRCYVKVEEAVTAQDPAYCRYRYGSVAGLDQKGAFRKSADATAAWVLSTVYTLGQRRVNDTGKLYECITAGTSAGSGGPTGTAADITDNTVHWKYISTDGAGAASAVIVKGGVFETGAAAGGFAILAFSKVTNQS